MRVDLRALDVRLDRFFEELRAELAPIRAALQTPLPTLLTLKRAAQELSMSPSTVKRLIQAGKLGTRKLGGRRMVPASEIRRLASLPGPTPRRGGGGSRMRTETTRNAGDAIRALTKRRR